MNTNSKYIPISNMLRSVISLFVFIGIYWYLLAIPPMAAAQEVSLSISPPILEVTIQPGKTVTQTYTIIDGGIPVVISPKIVPFVPLDQNGHPEIIEDPNSINAFSNWFSFDSTPVSLSSGDSHSFNVKFTPPEVAEEKDYYFTLLLATQNDNGLDINQTQSQARIGTNILLTISKDGNPQKSASISLFSAPRLIDSFQNIIYKVSIKNIGSAFFKPKGTITVNQILFGPKTTLKLAPQNVLVGGARVVSCIDGENLIPCQLPGKFLIGIYKATLSFTPDESGQAIAKETYTVAFPFSIVIAATILIFFYRMIKRLASHG